MSTLRPEKDPILKEITNRLVKAFSPVYVYLFGSQARGDGDGDSDYDIMVVVPFSDEPPYKRAQRAYLLLRGVKAAVDVAVWTREQFESRLHLKASFPATIVREGRLIYAA
jgi:predicted nucleotidyltransferase